MAILDDIRRFWDDDAATYDNAPGSPPHQPGGPGGVDRRPRGPAAPGPARVLDCGAGTGFLSLIAARLGHRVTALDLSPQMLDKLRAAAEAEGLDIAVVVGRRPRAARRGGGFDAVIERHLLWTLPDPSGGVARLAGGRRRAGGSWPSSRCGATPTRSRPARPGLEAGGALAAHRPRSPRVLFRRGAGCPAARDRAPIPAP